ncbi:MAG: hypothetical protein AAFR46_15985 [Pseudomonadota bacterium]
MALRLPAAKPMMAFKARAAGGLSARAMAALTAGSLVLAGCTQGEFLTWDPDTDAEKAMREKSERLQTTVTEGALSGFALGALIGGVLGGTEGAFQGAELGRLIGAGSGTYVRSLQEEFATREEVLDAVARDIAATNAALEATIADMRVVLEERRAALAEARETASSLARQQARTQRSLREMTGAIVAAEARETFFGEARTLLRVDNAATPQVDPELAALSERIAAMREIAEALAAEG